MLMEQEVLQLWSSMPLAKNANISCINIERIVLVHSAQHPRATGLSIFALDDAIFKYPGLLLSIDRIW